MQESLESLTIDGKIFLTQQKICFKILMFVLVKTKKLKNILKA